MKRIAMSGTMLARLLMSIVFLVNAIGVIDQSVPAKEAIERGIPADIVPFMMLSGRVIEFVGGLALLLGIVPQLAALALFAFLVPATFISHSFWLSAGTPAHMGQLINFSKNVAIFGGLLFIAAASEQPTLVPPPSFLIHRHERRA